MKEISQLKVLFVLLLTTSSCIAQQHQNPLFGEWGLLSFDDLYCNECPDLEFLNNGKGRLKFLSGEEVKFTYSVNISEQMATINFESHQIFFSRRKYFYSIITRLDGLIRVTLTSLDSYNKVVLIGEDMK